MSELAPLYLVAVPQLGDPNFARSVVLLLQHGSEGTFGLVVNNPTEVSLESFAQDQKFPCHSRLGSLPIFCGGPVEPFKGCILHADESVEERREIVPGLFVSSTPASLRTLLEKGEAPLRLLLGYAGWGGGQLEMELAQGGWLTTEANAKYALHTEPEKTWNTILKDMGLEPSRLALGGGIH